MKKLIILTSLVLSGCAGVSDTGYQNYVGPQGNPGLNGANGLGCYEYPVAPTGLSNDPAQYGGMMITCANSAQLITNGTPGVNGAPGAPGQAAQPVQFCSQYANNSGFPEYGFCINNNLYGVFWDGHNAWMAELPPGGYSSTSSGAPCNFTILPNCQVSQ